MIDEPEEFDRALTAVRECAQMVHMSGCTISQHFYLLDVFRVTATSGEITPQTSIYALELNSHVWRALVNAGIETVGELTKRSANELMEIHGFGPRSLELVQSALETSVLKLRE